MDREVTAAAARALGRHHGVECAGSGGTTSSRSRRPAKSLEDTTASATGWLQVACIATTLRHLSRVRLQRALALAA